MIQDGRVISDRTMEDSYGRKVLVYVDLDMVNTTELLAPNICLASGISWISLKAKRNKRSASRKGGAFKYEDNHFPDKKDEEGGVYISFHKACFP